MDLSLFKDKKIAIMGLGKTGLASANALINAGADIFAWDDSEEKRTAAKNINLVNLEDEDFAGYDALLLSPGIPHCFPEPHIIAKKAIDTNLKIISDIEILRECDEDRDLIAVSGTNGKSTTTSLLSHILGDTKDVRAGGNIGTPVLEFDSFKNDEGTYILELSSYQLERTSYLNADVAILLNITSDHLERHGGMDGYIKAKVNLFNKNNNKKSYAIISQDDENCRSVMKALEANENWDLIPFSVEQKIKGSVYIEDNYLIDDLDGQALKVLNLNMAKSLRGKHNHQNMVASYTACRLMYKLSPEDIAEKIISFKGLLHRQYLASAINGVAYVNDSKATNVDATAKALQTYNNIYWVVGGRPKEDGLEGLEQYMDKIKHAFLIGESTDEFANWFDNHNVPYMRCSIMDTAVKEAHAMAQDERGSPGGAGTVLLSPACASFDQYNCFEERGDKFMDIVKNCALEEAA